jgi:transcriptional regulator with XRE-family HTH domain
MAIDFRKLDQRRARLNMTKTAVAKRAKVSLPTVNRILSGKEPNPSVVNLYSIANALGVTIRIGASSGIEECEPAEEFRLKHARRKARNLVGMAQGTMALEAQAVEQADVERMVDYAAHDLLKSKRRLWGE